MLVRSLDLVLNDRQETAQSYVNGVRVGKYLSDVRFQKDDLPAFPDAVDILTPNTTREVVVIQHIVAVIVFLAHIPVSLGGSPALR